jgi:hypothetical protein
MKIYFYNIAHIGDSVFSKPYISEFIKQNKEFDVYLMKNSMGNGFMLLQIYNIMINLLNTYKI